MKKILTVALIVLTLCCLMCSCGDKEAAADNDTVVSAENADTYTFTFAGVKIATGVEAADVLASLGEANDTFTSESCAFGGEDTVYYYNGFQLSTNNETGVEKIFSVYLEDDSVATEEGISIGMTPEQVTAAYGEASSDSATGTSLIYSKGDMTLTFTLENGVVSSILYSNAD